MPQRSSLALRASVAAVRIQPLFARIRRHAIDQADPRHRRDGLLAGRVILEPALDHRAAVGLEGVPAKDTVGRTTPRSASDKGRIRSRTILPAPE